MKKYDHAKIEKKWQKEWEKQNIYKTLSSTAAAKKKQKPFYVLDMFPYPSGAGLHVGHPRGYIGSDVVARQKRMQGFNVLHPMGYDAFGLPAEQYAIQKKIHPRKAVEKNVATFEKQLSIIGLSYDWSRKINTTDPAYYKWTQWIFLKIYDSWFDTEKNKARPITELVGLFEKSGTEKISAWTPNAQRFSAKEWRAMGELEHQKILMDYRLAYEGYSEVNWCPELGTVLANDEIVDGPNGAPVSERGGYPVLKKTMRQWFMRITAYGTRLIDDLAALDWPEHIKDIERNWIGQSQGSEIDFDIVFKKNPADNDRRGPDGRVAHIPVFTTRADTLFGATYMVLAPEYPWVALATDKNHDVLLNTEEVKAYIESIKNRTDIERAAVGKAKTGIELKGVMAVNPATKKEIPIWIADYVLPNYGTGAVMAVPAHDERDFEFAKKYELPSTQVVKPRSHIQTESALVEDGVLINSGQFDGMTSDFARMKITEAVGGRIVTKFKFRDAVFARQRYWGEPIPLFKDAEGIIHEVSAKKLPLELPNVKSYEPTGTGESPLGGVSLWTKSGYETNTMPGWAGSSWYFLRYIDPHDAKAFASEAELDYWFNKKKKGGVDIYVGGAEHATGHALYARFWHKVLFDLGFVDTKEPFAAWKSQGMILAADGRKMSKRWGNVVNPDEVVATYGADTLRLYEMFIGPFFQSVNWSTESIIGPRRFIERVWRLQEKAVKTKLKNPSYEQALHQTIKKVTEDIESFSFNTAVSQMMICLNEMEKAEAIALEDFKKYLQILSPFAPHVSEELWHVLGDASGSFSAGKKSIHVSPWPKFDPKKLLSETMTIAISLNGKSRGTLTLPRTATEKEIQDRVLEEEQVKQALGGKTPKRVIYVPGRLVNIVF